ncbi:hypothetical protein [Legionella parisiensis]|uniref:hypothetical protein n=1 Tax=Legionella parisiensis TaxID=45071 RepID=UPI000B111790|nr:hypothetical protein [Legionella parisiensis]
MGNWQSKEQNTIDIGYDDAVTPGTIDAHYPVLISDLPAPKIRTYPIYTVIH